jgi:hypothetical protein
MTGKQHSIFDAVKHAVFEDEPEATHIPATAAPTEAPSAHPVATSSAAPASFASSPAQPIETGAVPNDDPVYKKLLAKTDFEGTDVAATIHKYLDPLKVIADSVMPPNVKFKTAVLQASAQAGLNEAVILGAFDRLKAQLQQEQDAFEEKARQFASREVSNRQDRIAQITTQISQLQQELAGLSGELVEAQGKATRAQSQFNAAAQRRAIEIEQQKAQYASLLKG